MDNEDNWSFGESTPPTWICQSCGNKAVATKAEIWRYNKKPFAKKCPKCQSEDMALSGAHNNV